MYFRPAFTFLTNVAVDIVTEEFYQHKKIERENLWNEWISESRKVIFADICNMSGSPAGMVGWDYIDEVICSREIKTLREIKRDIMWMTEYELAAKSGYMPPLKQRHLSMFVFGDGPKCNNTFETVNSGLAEHEMRDLWSYQSSEENLSSLIYMQQMLLCDTFSLCKLPCQRPQNTVKSDVCVQLGLEGTFVPIFQVVINKPMQNLVTSCIGNMAYSNKSFGLQVSRTEAILLELVKNRTKREVDLRKTTFNLTGLYGFNSIALDVLQLIKGMSKAIYVQIDHEDEITACVHQYRRSGFFTRKAKVHLTHGSTLSYCHMIPSLAYLKEQSAMFALK